MPRVSAIEMKNEKRRIQNAKHRTQNAKLLNKNKTLKTLARCLY